MTTEAYPYGAGMTEIQSALFDDWESWPDDRFAQHQLVSTGERLTRATFAAARKTGGTVIIHGRSEAQTRAAIASPLSMIASDGFIENGRGHPRTSGTFAKVLGRYVREEKAVPLTDALRRMTIEPAKRLEKHTPAMLQKGRLKVGADADVTVFDPATVIDRATYESAGIPSAGIPYVDRQRPGGRRPRRGHAGAAGPRRSSSHQKALMQDTPARRRLSERRYRCAACRFGPDFRNSSPKPRNTRPISVSPPAAAKMLTRLTSNRMMLGSSGRWRIGWWVPFAYCFSRPAARSRLVEATPVVVWLSKRLPPAS